MMTTRQRKRLLPIRSGPMPLWLWMGLRMSALAIGAIVAVAVGMWAYFHLHDQAILNRMPPRRATRSFGCASSRTGTRNVCGR